ncbi:MAG: hypothetical protein IPL70_19310 [Uliginosibacterium sp.]|nr:hypothetical protein [Uliginosibacterium sp.]
MKPRSASVFKAITVRRLTPPRRWHGYAADGPPMRFTTSGGLALTGPILRQVAACPP